jgi:hypothetical protein
VVDAGGTALETLDRASGVLGISIPKNQIEQPT